MASRFVLAGVAWAAGATTSALAGADDYVLEPVQTEVTMGELVVAVRLKHKATGKPVTDAVIFRTRIDMAPDAMAEMEAPLTPVPSSEPGVYAFKTELSMQGRWQLSVAAKVQGERETIVGQVTFEATR
jgi:YtkA-like